MYVRLHVSIIFICINTNCGSSCFFPSTHQYVSMRVHVRACAACVCVCVRYCTHYTSTHQYMCPCEYTCACVCVCMCVCVRWCAVCVCVCVGVQAAGEETGGDTKPCRSRRQCCCHPHSRQLCRQHTHHCQPPTHATHTAATWPVCRRAKRGV